MKKLVISVVVLLIFNIALIITFVFIKPPIKYIENIKYNPVKVVHCTPKSDNAIGKDTYIYLSKYNRVEKVVEKVYEKFNTFDEYNKSVEFKKQIADSLKDVEFIFDDQDLSIVMEQTTSHLNEYLSLSEIMKYYSKYSCDYEEYYE